jgi:hypothetical protein
LIPKRGLCLARRIRTTLFLIVLLLFTGGSALVAADPMFAGDDAAFCAAYASGSYAPDLRKWEGNQ